MNWKPTTFERIMTPIPSNREMSGDPAFLMVNTPIVSHEEAREDRWIWHRLIFEHPVPENVALAIVEKYRYFGYHPMGYGFNSFTTSDGGRTWTWAHWDSCE